MRQIGDDLVDPGRRRRGSILMLCPRSSTLAQGRIATSGRRSGRARQRASVANADQSLPSSVSIAACPVMRKLRFGRRCRARRRRSAKAVSSGAEGRDSPDFEFAAAPMIGFPAAERRNAAVAMPCHERARRAVRDPACGRAVVWRARESPTSLRRRPGGSRGLRDTEAFKAILRACFMARVEPV